MPPQPRPDSGAGSEFGKEARELARRRRLGFIPRQKRPEDLPWLVTTKDIEKEKTKDRQYIGKKSIVENSSYFVFIKCADGGFEAHPIDDWYTFAPINTYKPLTAEEAEEEFKRRHKVLNKYMIMANRRKADDEDLDEEGGGGGGGTSKSTGLKPSVNYKVLLI